jgi:hypothetical protein
MVTARSKKSATLSKSSSLSPLLKDVRVRVGMSRGEVTQQRFTPRPQIHGNNSDILSERYMLATANAQENGNLRYIDDAFMCLCAYRQCSKDDTTT